MTITAATTQYCTFWVDGLYLGVGVADVQEVLRFQEMSSAPGAPVAVRGLLNLRGQIVTAIDLRHQLGLPERPAGKDAMNVVIRSRTETVSLLVDDIGDVIHTAADAVLEPAPTTIPAAVRTALHGVIPLHDQILLVLDADRAGDVTEAHTPGGTQ